MVLDTLGTIRQILVHTLTQIQDLLMKKTSYPLDLFRMDGIRFFVRNEEDFYPY